MTKRRDFIKKSVLGITAGIATGGRSLSAESSIPVAVVNRTQKDWQHDAEWMKIKFGDWGGPGVSSQPGPMDNILLKD